MTENEAKQFIQDINDYGQYLESIGVRARFYDYAYAIVMLVGIIAFFATSFKLWHLFALFIVASAIWKTCYDLFEPKNKMSLEEFKEFKANQFPKLDQ